MQTIIENINDILTTKNNLANLISKIGEPIPRKFIEYPSAIDDGLTDIEELVNEIIQG